MSKKKQRLGTAVIMLFLLLIVGGSVYSFFVTREEETEQQEEMHRGDEERFWGMDGMVSASGTTAIGMDAVIFEIDFLEEASLYVEEVYASNGDTLEAGSKLFKLTDESVEEAREELENTAKDAELTYRSSAITTNQSKIQAKYTYEKALLEANQAAQVYEDTVAELQEKVDKAKSAYDDAQEAYNELYGAVTNNTLRDVYEVDEKKEAYQEAHEMYITMVANSDLTEEELSGASSGTQSMVSATTAQNTGGAQMGKGMDKEAAEEAAYKNSVIKTIQLLKEEDEEAEKAYEQAQSDYEEALESAELDLKTLLNKLETAREDYEEAKLTFQKESTSAKSTYELAIAKQGTAQTDYDTMLTGLEESLEKLQDAKEEADENLALFEELVGDGYYYIEEAGTILMIRASEGQALAGNDMIFAYSNPAEISVSVSVSQEDIAELSVGDTATVMISEAGNYTGTITMINPIASSDSRTSVSYTVEVALEGDVSELEANLSATVIFGELEMPENMGKPEGMERPSDMEMPQEMGKPGGMEMPEGMERPADMGNRPQRQEEAVNE